MDCFDLIVVGSGPGATFAAYGAKGRRVLMVDVGIDAAACPEMSGSAYALRQAGDDLFHALIGDRFEALHNLHQPPISLKLKSPYMAYVMRDWNRLSPLVGDRFGGVLSLAKGGLANGWGAGVYRFTDRDLRGFPMDAASLRPFYDEVEAHIGICGANDDLEPYFGRDEALLPPLQLSSFFADFLARYERARPRWLKHGISIGRARLAVLTEPRNGRAAYEYGNLEFFRPHDPAIYTPAYTVDEMIQAGAIQYRPGRLVLRYREANEGVEVMSRNLETDLEETVWARKLALGAGAFNTARIVLASNRDYETRLPVLDNPMVLAPFIDPRRIGIPEPGTGTSLAQLNFILEDRDGGEPLQGSLYGASGPLRSDVLFSLPLPVRAGIKWAKHLTPATGAAILFYPGMESAGNSVRLRPSGELEVHFDGGPPRTAEARLARLFRGLGYLCGAALMQRPPLGAGLHYAGTLPMRADPARYQTGPDGRLHGTRNVYIVDGACISRLPAKNLTFTIMANALRIGRHVAAELA